MPFFFVHTMPTPCVPEIHPRNEGRHFILEVRESYRINTIVIYQKITKSGMFNVNLKKINLINILASRLLSK